MIKILTHYYPQLFYNLPVYGGPSRQLGEFQKYLKKKNSQCQLIGLTIDTGENRERGFEKFNRGGNTLYRLGMPGLKYIEEIKKFTSLDDISFAFRRISETTKKIIEKEKPDVVFLNGFSWTIWLMLREINNHNIPVVLVRSGIATKEFLIYENFFGKKATKVLLEMEKTICAENFYNIFLNQFSKKVYEKEALEKKCKYSFIVPLSVANNYFNARPKPKKENKSIKVGVVSRWDRIKNHRAILEIAQYAETKSLPIEFISITRIPPTKINEKMKNEYRRLLKVIDPMPIGKLIEFYQDIDVLICPSHFDVSPTIIFESLLCGTPALISPNVGQVDIFKKFKLGSWIIDFSKTASAARKIQNIKNEKIPEGLIKYLRENHSEEAVFGQYLKIIKKAASSSKAV